ncbi:MAG: Protoporphyrinogen oxidase [Pseudomonadota bacterium]|jgi:phytoene dehydrogenase-like protein
MGNVIIVGAGLSGLACARELSHRGMNVTVFEEKPYVGGRASTLRTEEGFLLDRGFQVFLTAYPEAHRVFDYAALELGFFAPGAIVRWNKRFHTLADPLRAPRHILKTALAPIVSWGDKLRIARLQFEAFRPTFGDLTGPESTTLEALKRRGMSREIIERFFRPFFGGIFLESGLETSDRMFEFVFKMFTLGFAALPARGMGVLGEALRDDIRGGQVSCNAPVSRVSAHAVQLESGEGVSADAVVVATDGVAAHRFIDEPPRQLRGVTNLYFSAPRSPLDAPMLVLNGEGRGVINNLAVPSDIAPGYAPAGGALISVTVLEEQSGGRSAESLQGEVLAEARGWFGDQVGAWRYVGGFSIERALPMQVPPYFTRKPRLPEAVNEVFRCGDYLTSGSIQGALLSGRLTAERIVEHLKR